MTVNEIVRSWLVDNGYDGLFCSDMPCACEADDLAPCGEMHGTWCEPGYKHPCDGRGEECEGDCGWHMGPSKPTD